MADPKKLDTEAGFEVLEDFERFNQKNDIYSRAFWDSGIRSANTERFFQSGSSRRTERRSRSGRRSMVLRSAITRSGMRRGTCPISSPS